MEFTPGVGFSAFQRGGYQPARIGSSVHPASDGDSSVIADVVPDCLVQRWEDENLYGVRVLGERE